MLIELTRKSIRVWADFRAKVTLKSVRDNFAGNTQTCQVNLKYNTQNQYELVALVNNWHSHPYEILCPQATCPSLIMVVGSCALLFATPCHARLNVFWPGKTNSKVYCIDLKVIVKISSWSISVTLKPVQDRYWKLSIIYFNCIPLFDMCCWVSVNIAGAHMCFVDAWISDSFMKVQQIWG